MIIFYREEEATQAQIYEMKLLQQKKEKKDNIRNNNKKKHRIERCFSIPESTAPSVATSHVNEGYEGAGYLFEITERGIERSESFKTGLDQEQPNDQNYTVVDIERVDGEDKPPVNDLKIPIFQNIKNAEKYIDDHSVDSESVYSATGSINNLLPPSKTTRPVSWSGPLTDHLYDDQHSSTDNNDENYQGSMAPARGNKRHPDPHRQRYPQNTKMRYAELKQGNLKKLNQYTDTKGRPRSMTDLRVLAMSNGNNPSKARSDGNLHVARPRKAPSVENIHTGGISTLAPRPRHEQHKYGNKPKGIWANSLER